MMKIRIAYIPDEDDNAPAAIDALLKLFPDAKIKASEKYAPYKHIYITTRNPLKRGDFKG